MKKVFLWGDYDAFQGGIKIFKEKEDYLVIGLRCHENFRHQQELFLDSVRYVKNTDVIPAFRSFYKYFKQVRPDYLLVTAGFMGIEPIDEFNKIKAFCDEYNCELAVVKTYKEQGLTMIVSTEMFVKVGSIYKKGS